MSENPQRSNPTRWLAVANPLAGGFAGLQTANELAAASGHHQVDVYATAEDPAQRIREIVERITAHEPTLDNPLGILAFGGDRTVNDAFVGVMTYLFPDLNALLAADPAVISERMAGSGITIGVVREGGANDVGNLIGAPAPDPQGILAYIDSAQLVPLGVGLVQLDGQSGPHLFVHAASAGNLVGPVLRDLQGERGNGAMWRRIFKGLAHFLFARPTTILWQAAGPIWRTQVVEVYAHTTPLAAGIAGLASTPAEGIGVKIGSANNVGRRFVLVVESMLRGLLSQLGFLRAVGPESRFASIPAQHQIQLKPGQQVEVLFLDDTVPVQVSGDYVAGARHLVFRALPSYPGVLVMGGSVMARIHDSGVRRQETEVRIEANRLKGRRVLMLDDQTCVINTVRPFLEMWDMEIVTATDPEEALRLLQTEDFDLLITDLVMPKLDGVTLLNKLIESNRFIPTLVLSGSQGNRQAAVLHHELANGIFRELGLPLLYMKKEANGFEEELRDRLTYLAQKPRFHHERVAEEALPRLRSVIAQDTTAGDEERSAAIDPDRKKLVGLMIDKLCDLRFTLLVELDPFEVQISAFEDTRPDIPQRFGLGVILAQRSQVPLRPREELALLDEAGWHTFKNEVQFFWGMLDVLIRRLDSYHAPASLREKAAALYTKATALVILAGEIEALILAGRGQYKSRIFKTLRTNASPFNQANSVELAIPAEDGPLLNLPSQFAIDAVHHLIHNALQATPFGKPKPVFHVAIVPAEDPFSTMRVKPETDDPLGNAHRPSADKIVKQSTRYLVIGCVNHGETIPPAIREGMLSDQSFTTKEFGTGLGLPVLKEHLKAVDGWLEVQSRDGLTEVATFVPIDGRIVTDPEPTGGGSPNGPTGGGTPTSVTPATGEGQGRGSISGSNEQRVRLPALNITRSGSPPPIVARGGDDMRKTVARGKDDRKITQLALALHRRGMRRTARFVLRMTDDQLSRFVKAAGRSSLRLLAKAAGAPEEIARIARNNKGEAATPSVAGRPSFPFTPAAAALPAPSVLMSLAR